MTEQLSATRQPTHRRLARGLYWRGLAFSFRALKVPLSAVANSVAPKAPWTSFAPRWDTLEAYADWLSPPQPQPQHVVWRPDPLGGLLDYFPSLDTIAAQFRDKGKFEDDCDGLALFSAQNVRQFADDPDAVYIVTLIMDPFSFDGKALERAAHVICVFRREGVWRVVSNTDVFDERFPSLAAAVQKNSYCIIHPVLWAEVRNTRLRRLASGPDLDAIGQSMERRHSDAGVRST